MGFDKKSLSVIFISVKAMKRRVPSKKEERETRFGVTGGLLRREDGLGAAWLNI